LKGEKIMARKKEVKSNITVEGANIQFRNFSGKEGQFNRKGDRNFCLFLDNEFAKTLLTDGWNIKELQPRNPDDAPQPYLQVSVGFSHYPPKIVLITTTGKTFIDESTVDILDWAEIDNVDLIIRPYNWELNGKFGVKAYLKTMYITIVEDEFASKYRNVPDSAVAAPDDLEPPWDSD
jgi:hypothetical protein